MPLEQDAADYASRSLWKVETEKGRSKGTVKEYSKTEQLRCEECQQVEEGW
jgi:hypothetical protein